MITASLWMKSWKASVTLERTAELVVVEPLALVPKALESVVSVRCCII